MSRASASSDALVFGGTPRVHLLPREIEDQRKSQSLRRALLFGLVAAVAVVVLAVIGLSFLVAAATLGQASEQTRSQQLQAEKAKYAAVTAAQTQIDNITVLQPLATQNEVLWVDLIASIKNSLPADISVTGIDVKLGNDAPGAEVDPLVGEHIGKMGMIAEGTQSAIAQWLINLASVKGVVGAVPGEVAIVDGDVYRLTVDVYLNKDILSHRFDKAATTDPADTSEVTP